MIDVVERQNDILELVSQLDITPTMYKNADEKYHALASFLEDCGIDAEMYPHGSFAFGTVVRPSVKNPNAAYDLDFVCQVRETKDCISPNELRRIIETALKSSEQYSSKLQVYEECYTIEYADIDGIGFTIDIVPAANETLSRKLELAAKSARPDLMNTAVAIPRCNDRRTFTWLTNNPRGFQKWFEEINQPFLNYNRENRRHELFKANRHIYASVNDIPVGLERSAMQRVIQILKYHRDVYYLKLHREDNDTLKPISAIINTLVAEIAKSANPQLSIFDLLEYVLHELNIYAKQQTLNYDQFKHIYGARSIIARTKSDQRWIIENPADPEDNLADKWNFNADIPKYFFLWVTACENDLIHSLRLPDNQFRTAMDNAFGATTIQKNWANKYKAINQTAAKPIVTTSKPFRQ